MEGSSRPEKWGEYGDWLSPFSRRLNKLPWVICFIWQIIKRKILNHRGTGLNLEALFESVIH